MIGINIREYLTDDEIKNLIIEQIQLAAQRYFAGDNIEHLLNKLSDRMAPIMVDEILKKENTNYEDRISETVLEVIDSLTAFTVFRKKDGYSCNQDSVGRQLLDQACIANKDTINDKVVRMINDLDLDSIKDKVAEIIAEKVIEMLNDKE